MATFWVWDLGCRIGRGYLEVWGVKVAVSVAATDHT